MKHGRDTKGVVHASDVAGHDDAQGTPLPTHPAVFGHVFFFFFLADLHRHGYDSGRFVLNWANLGRIGRNCRNRRFRTKFKKKKKRCKTHRLKLILKTLLQPISHKHQTSTASPLTSSLTRLCAHCSVCSLPLSHLPCISDCETLSHSALSQLTHFSSFFLQLSLTHS